MIRFMSLPAERRSELVRGILREVADSELSEAIITYCEEMPPDDVARLHASYTSKGARLESLRAVVEALASSASSGEGWRTTPRSSRSRKSREHHTKRLSL